jgi:hypothetical protein
MDVTSIKVVSISSGFRQGMHPEFRVRLAAARMHDPIDGRAAPMMTAL